MKSNIASEVAWALIGAGVGYLVAGVNGSMIGLVIGFAIFRAAKWWMDTHYDPAFVGPVLPPE
jgi:uncharacterized membrane protein